MVKVILSGVETNNKGAELMLYAILQELERVHPDSVVYIEKKMIKQGRSYIKSPININIIPESRIANICNKIKLTGVLNRIGILSKFLNQSCPVKDADYFIDGSGLIFSDKRISSPLTEKMWRLKLKAYRDMGAKIIFLPQGFGPFKKKCTFDTIKVLDEFSDLIFAREKVSYNYLLASVTHKEKVKLFPDFTSLVEGIVSPKYSYLKNKVCFIPNVQMINKGILSKESYFNLIEVLIDCCRENKLDVYFLNHEGIKDELLAKDFISERDSNVKLVTGLNAFEVKWLISTAYLVISSRFHGVASSLNTGVPCLATSWHHKYAELFNDFGVDDCVLPLDDVENCKAKVLEFINPDVNNNIRQQLSCVKPEIMDLNKKMWDLIWSLKSS